MKSKKILALILVLSTTSALSFSSMAEEVSLLDSLPAVQYEVETRGNAETLSEDDYLLDGNYENGELINGSIYHSEAEAVEGVKQDRIMARTIANSSESEPKPDLARIYPNTGIIEGISSTGSFYYNIQTSGTTPSAYWNVHSTVWVDSQSDVYYSKSQSTGTNDNYSYILTVMSDGNAVGSFRGYADDVKGGANFTIPGDSMYIKLATENFPRNEFLHGSGSVDD